MFKCMVILSLVLATQLSLAKETIQTIALQVTEKGFEPNSINAKAGSHVILKVTRLTENTCATEIKIKEKNIKKDLPLNKEVTLDVGILKKGKITFACGMNMITGYIVTE